jgi:hypothetical protein
MLVNVLYERLSQTQDRIAAAAQRVGRTPGEVRLIGVTKTHPPDVVRAAVAAGLIDLGENRVQEAEPKIAALADLHTSVTWRLIGHLQSNKARRAAALFDCIDSVDSLRLAQALDRHASETRGDTETRRHGNTETGRPGDRETAAAQVDFNASLHPFTPSSLHPFTGSLPILLQVNVSGEASKEGFALVGWEERRDVLDAFLTDVEQILALPHLRVDGLMTIAPWGDDPEEARPTFCSTRRLRDELARRFPAVAWSELSMGMTDDFEIAIEEGSTQVRIGRAIFGERAFQS